MIGSDLLTRAATILQDAANTRWPLAELVNWINDGQRAVVLAKPSANAPAHRSDLHWHNPATTVAARATQHLMEYPMLRHALSFSLLIAAVLFIVAPARGAEWALDAMNNTIEQTNFLVNAGCSGTLIDKKQRVVLTAAHCVDDQYRTVEREKVNDDGVVTKEKVRKLVDGTVTQFDFSGPETVRTVVYRVRLLAVDKDKDLAILKISGRIPNTTESPIACANASRGERVYIVGNPMGTLYSSVTTGIVSSMQRDYALLDFPTPNGDNKEPLMQVSGGIVGGNSGGAIYNAAGEIIGISLLAHRTNEVLGFGAPVVSLKTFLKTNKLESLFARCPADATVPAED